MGDMIDVFLGLPRDSIGMILKDYGWIVLMSWALTYAPVFAPLKYAAISWAILTWYDPILVFITATLWASLGTVSLMILNAYTNVLIQRYKEAKRKWDKEDHVLENRWELSSRESFKQRKHDVYEKLQIVNNIPTLFGLTIVGVYTVIPDILIIKLTQHRIGVSLFLLATCIGKSVTNFVIVFGVDWLQNLFL